MNADVWGVSTGYDDTAGVRHSADPAAQVALRRALGAPDDGSGEPPAPGAYVVRIGESLPLSPDTEITLEDGTTAQASDPLPAGYHRCGVEERDVRIIVVPPTAAASDGMRTWGWAIQLYAARTRRSWGIGDLADLAMFNQRSAAMGAGMTLVNPLHSATPVSPMQPSPYFPTTRCFRNPLYASIEATPGYAELAADLAPLAASARRLLSNRRIDRDAVWTDKRAALGQLWSRFADRAPAKETNGFRTYLRTTGPLVSEWAAFCVLSERHGADWRCWPDEDRLCTTALVERVSGEDESRVGFHQWLQWLLDTQLAEAGRPLTLMSDLAVGVDRAGFDTWRWPGSYCGDLTIGAPPDDFNTQGQSWGLPPWNHWALRADGYDAFIATVKAAFRNAGALRIDHVMGLFRIWTIPPGGSPTDGCYVYLPFRDLLGIIALESQRARAYVVGEDLGTVEPYVREALAEHDVLSYKLLQFEPGPTNELPERAMVAFTTHDLPTIGGFWTGSDLVETSRIGVRPNVDGTRRIRSTLAALAGIDQPPEGAGARATLDAVAHAVHADLATAPCRIVTATLEDAIGVEQRPNVPGTIDEWPNWRIALPIPLEDVLTNPGTIATAQTLTNR